MNVNVKLVCEHGHKHVIEYRDFADLAHVEDHFTRAHSDGCFTIYDDGTQCHGTFEIETEEIEQ